MTGKLLTIACVILLAGTMASAQTTTPRFDIFGGYSHFNNFDIGLDGWIGSANWTWNRWFGITGAVSGHYGTKSFGEVGVILPTVPTEAGSHEHNFDFGPTFTFRREKFNGFTHILFGFSHTNVNSAGQDEGDTSFSWVWGVGADFNFSQKLAARFQIDLVRTNFFDEGVSHARPSVGIVYRLSEH